MFTNDFHSFRIQKRRKLPLVKQNGSKKAHQSKKKIEKMNFFKTTQNAIQYDVLVFQNHFMVIFYGFRSEFACLRTIFTLFGSKNIENYLWLSKSAAKKAHQIKKKSKKMKFFKTVQNAIHYDVLVFLKDFKEIGYKTETYNF